MLLTRQDACIVGDGARLARRTGTVEFFNQLREAQVASADRALRGDSGHTALDFFADRYVDLHDALSVRDMQGEPLTDEERAMLGALDAVLDEIGPEQPGLPPEINELVGRVLRAHGL